MIDDPDVREAVSLYVRGAASEAEAAELAGIPRSQLRYYARTCGVVAPPGPGSGSESGSPDEDSDPPSSGN